MSLSPGMIAGDGSILTGMKLILLVSIAVGISAAALAYRERPEPGSTPLIFLLAGQSWWSITILFRISTVDPGRELFWLKLSWIGTVVIPVAWLFFCLEYTGHHRYVQARYIALASVIPALTAVISLTNGYHQLLYLDTNTIEHGSVLVGTPGVWYWVIAGYTYLLGVSGAIPLLEVITDEPDMFRGQSLTLLLGLSVPWATNLLYLFGAFPTAGIDPTPAAFAVSGVAYLGAITRFQLFEANPAPIREARFTVFERMQNGAIVVDSRKNIVKMNAQAEQILNRRSSEILGTHIGEFIPHINTILGKQSSRLIFRPEDTIAAYDISVNKLTNFRDQTTGWIITLHDISEHIQQQQRLEVLNRVFRHNVRTNTQVIIGKSEFLAKHNSKAAAKTIQENALEIEDISQKARTILEMFEHSRDRVQGMSLERCLNSCVSTIRDQYPDVTIETDLHREPIYVSSVLENVFINLLENAAEHNTNSDPRIWIDTHTTEEQARITVADNGPGIDDQELALLKEGKETPLEHGTGFGLAIIIWGTAIADGEITFENNNPTGLIVTVEVPRYHEPDKTEGSPPLQEGTRPTDGE